VRLLLDQNLSHKILQVLDGRFEGSAHVRDHGLQRSSDDEVWRFAKEHGFAIVTKDADFVERSILEGAPPKVLRLNIGNATTQQAVHAIAGWHNNLRLAALEHSDDLAWLELQE